MAVPSIINVPHNYTYLQYCHKSIMLLFTTVSLHQDMAERFLMDSMPLTKGYLLVNSNCETSRCTVPMMWLGKCVCV